MRTGGLLSRWRNLASMTLQRLLMPERYPHNPTPYDDDWEDSPSSDGLWTLYVLGLVLPLACIAFGAVAMARGSVVFPFHDSGVQPWTLRGGSAVALGLAS